MQQAVTLSQKDVRALRTIAERLMAWAGRLEGGANGATAPAPKRRRVKRVGRPTREQAEAAAGLE